eukprot:10209007-Prorocentrum_lima.AAC.1
MAWPEQEITRCTSMMSNKDKDAQAGGGWKKWTPVAVSRAAFTTTNASQEVRRARCGRGGCAQHAG